MAEKKRLGDGPAEIRKAQVKEAVGLETKKQRDKTIKTQKTDQHTELRKRIEAGKAKNYYVNKDGNIIAKVTIYLPLEMVTELKKTAVDRMISLSDLCREKLR
jgi:hypothetical protein